MTDEYVLSQADIDAMVAKGGGASAPVDDVATESPVKVKQVTESLSNIRSIPAKREAPAPKPASPQETKPKPTSSSSSEVVALRNTVAELTSRINRMEAAMLKSQKSFRCDIRNNFHCGHCKTQGKVAMYLKCTDCGEEQWVGWWPQQR